MAHNIFFYCSTTLSSLPFAWQLTMNLRILRTRNLARNIKQLFCGLVGFVGCLLVYFSMYSIFKQNYTIFKSNNDLKDRKTLPNYVENLKLSSRASKKIFFHETSPIRDGVIWLNSRQACSIESAGESLHYTA